MNDDHDPLREAVVSDDHDSLSDAQRELLSAYLDGEADATERAAAEALLAAEPAARAWLEEARADAALLAALAPGVDVEALDQARRRAEAETTVCAYEEGRREAERRRRASFWSRLREALTPSRVTGLAVPALAILVAVLAPDRPGTSPGIGPGARPATPLPAATAPTEVAAAPTPAATEAVGAPHQATVNVRSLSDAPPLRTEVVPRDPETMVVAMHLPEADVDLIWMMPPGGKRTRRKR